MDEFAASRAKWLARLVQAVEDAQSIAWSLRTDPCSSGEARTLYDRLEQARVVLEEMRGVRTPPHHSLDIDWLQSLGLGSPQKSHRRPYRGP